MAHGSNKHAIELRNRTLAQAVLLPVVLAPSLGSLAVLWFWPGTVGAGIYASCKAVLYGVPAVVAFCEASWEGMRRSLRCGLPGVGMGLAGGAAAGSLTALCWILGTFEGIEATRLIQAVKEAGLNDPLSYWSFAAWLSIGNSALEEFVFRWFVDSRLRRIGLQDRWVFPVSACIFTAHHVIVLAAFFAWPLVLLGSCAVFVAGVIWSWSLRKWDSIVPGWIMHGLVDVTILSLGAALISRA